MAVHCHVCKTGQTFVSRQGKGEREEEEKGREGGGRGGMTGEGGGKGRDHGMAVLSGRPRRRGAEAALRGNADDSSHSLSMTLGQLLHQLVDFTLYHSLMSQH